MSGDLWSRIWLLCQAYPAQAGLFIVLLSLVGTLIALAIVSMIKPTIPLDQWQDDADQVMAVTRPAPLDTHIATTEGTAPWRRSGGNWRGEL